MGMMQRYARLSADHRRNVGAVDPQAEWENAETLMEIGAPGWDRTSNPCLRRAVLYPLSYGRAESGLALAAASATGATCAASECRREEVA